MKKFEHYNDNVSFYLAVAVLLCIANVITKGNCMFLMIVNICDVAVSFWYFVKMIIALMFKPSKYYKNVKSQEGK